MILFSKRSRSPKKLGTTDPGSRQDQSHLEQRVYLPSPSSPSAFSPRNLRRGRELLPRNLRRGRGYLLLQHLHTHMLTLTKYSDFEEHGLLVYAEYWNPKLGSGPYSEGGSG